MASLRKTKIDDHVWSAVPSSHVKGQNVNIKGTALQNLKRKPVVMPRIPRKPTLVFPKPGWNDKRRT